MFNRIPVAGYFALVGLLFVAMLLGAIFLPSVLNAPLAPTSAVVSADNEACGFNTEDYGSGLVICDGDITSWANGNNDTYLYDDGTTNTVRTTHENGVVSEVSISESGISAYIG